MKKSVMVIVAFSAAVMAQAGLVARWDFNNFDPENPKSANILKATFFNRDNVNGFSSGDADLDLHDDA